jgi:UDP-N-acetylglucosamine 2-epimerase
MIDLALETAESLEAQPAVLARFGVLDRDYAVATIHRAANTEDEAVFARLIAGLRRTGMPVIFPIHPRTRALAQLLCVGLDGDTIVASDPLSYREMIALQKHARCVITDSGGVQKESVVLGTPCVTLRDTTEWTQTLEDGWNVLAGDDPARIAEAARRPRPRVPSRLSDEKRSAERIARAMLEHFSQAQQVAV